jgi:hypothetical protein
MGEVDALERLLVLVLEAAALGEVFHRFLMLRLFVFFDRLLVFENFVDTECAIIILVLEDVVPDAPSLEP